MLLAVILPAINSSREAARRLGCVNNLKNITLALSHRNQAIDRRQTLDPYRLPIQLAPALDSAINSDLEFTNQRLSHVWRCPSASKFDASRGNFSYLANQGLRQWTKDQGTMIGSASLRKNS